MSNSILLVGGGGHCKVIIDIIKENNEYDQILISDIEENKGKEILGIKIDYTDDDLEGLYKKGIKNAFISIGNVNITTKREELYNKLKSIGFNLPVIASKSANISKHAKINEGTLVGKNVVINPEVKIGKNCIINTGAIIEHDCVIEDNVHIAPGVVLSGGVKIDKNNMIGIGVRIIQGVTIDSDILIGAGSTVINNLKESGIYVGTPAKKIKDL
jgi:UDP-perosamine 4-acetyltransferase